MALVRAPLRPAAGEQAFWREAAVGSRARCSYSDDDVDHERYLIWPARRVREDGAGIDEEEVWWVLSPDGDVWKERLDGGDPETGPNGARPLPNVGYPMMGGRRLYKFRERPTVDQILALSRGCRDIETARGQLRRDWPRHLVDEAGHRDELAAALGAPADLAVPAEAGAADESIWVLMEPGGGHSIGEEVLMSPTDVVAGPDGLKYFGAELCRVRRVAVGSAPAAASEQVARLRRALASAEQLVDESVEKGVKERLGLGSGDGGGDASGREDRKATSSLDDIRTLSVDFDGHGERFKDWRSVVSEITAESFADDPIEGPVSIVHLCKAMYKSGGDPMRWLAEWSREHRIERTDRIYHELEVLCHVLLLAGTYDQVNLGGLRSMERLARRIQVITDAHSVPGAPANWRMARYLTGDTGPGDVVAPELRSFGAKRAKDDTEFLNARVRGLTGAERPKKGDGKGDGTENPGKKGPKGPKKVLDATASGAGQ